MQITVSIPDDIAAQLATDAQALSRTALEALALEGYRTERLSEAEIRSMLGFATRTEVHAFLKQHSVWMHYSLEDAERDMETSRKARERSRREQPPRQLRAG